jgi:hypothetical protein
MRELEPNKRREVVRTVIVELIVNPFPVYQSAEVQLARTGGRTSLCFYCLLESTVRKRGEAWVS